MELELILNHEQSKLPPVVWTGAVPNDACGRAAESLLLTRGLDPYHRYGVVGTKPVLGDDDKREDCILIFPLWKIVSHAADQSRRSA